MASPGARRPERVSRTLRLRSVCKCKCLKARPRFRSSSCLDASVHVFPCKRESTCVCCCFCALNPSVCSPSPGPRALGPVRFLAAARAPARPPWRRPGLRVPFAPADARQPLCSLSCGSPERRGQLTQCSLWSILAPSLTLPPLQTLTRRVSS